MSEPESSGIHSEERASASLFSRGRTVADPSEGLVQTDEPATDEVTVVLVAPWRVTEFRTPALPGVVLTPDGVTLPREDAKMLYDEAVRSGFGVTSSEQFADEAPSNEGGTE